MDGEEQQRTESGPVSTPPSQGTPASRPLQGEQARSQAAAKAPSASALKAGLDAALRAGLKAALKAALKKWAFAVVPVVGVLELGAHLVQAHSSIPESDWKNARDYVAAASHPDDLVTFAPRWVDPIGREEFGPDVATLQREARPDESRFPRAFEVSIRGQHDPTLDGWKQTEERGFGKVSVATLENPTPVHVLDDLVSFVGPQRMQVSKVEGVEGDRVVDCPFGHGSPQSGGLGAGPAIPGDRFACPGGGFVVASVAADLAYRPRRCIYAPPQGKSVTRLRFLGVQIGHTLHGHHGIYVEAERNRTGTPVTLTFKVGDAVLGSVVHNDGDGWKSFEFDTTALDDATKGRADVVAEIESPSGDHRTYCFEADTR